MGYKIPLYRKQSYKYKPDVGYSMHRNQRYYFGEYNTPESLEKYQRFLAGLRANNGSRPSLMIV